MSKTISINDSDIQTRFELKYAEKIAYELLEKLQSHFIRYQICGSIRRKKSTVGDIDLVAIPKVNYKFGDESLSNFIKRIDPEGYELAKSLGKPGPKRFLDGDLIKRFTFKGISVDLYLANENTFGTLVLIRTGSKEHNIRLTSIARSKNLKLFASGKGLCEVDESDNIIKIISMKEDEILSTLLDYIPPPKARN